MASRRGWAAVWRQVLDSSAWKGQTPTTKLVLAWVILSIRHELVDGTPAGSVDCTQEDIAADCEISVRSVRQALAALSECETVEVSRNGRGIRITAPNWRTYAVPAPAPLPGPTPERSATVADRSAGSPVDEPTTGSGCRSDRQPLPIRPATVADRKAGRGNAKLRRSATVAALSISGPDLREEDLPGELEPPGRELDPCDSPQRGDVETRTCGESPDSGDSEVLMQGSAETQRNPEPRQTRSESPQRAKEPTPLANPHPTPETPDSGQMAKPGKASGVRLGTEPPEVEKLPAPHVRAIRHFHERFKAAYGNPPSWNLDRGGEGAMAFAKLVKRWGPDEVIRRVDYAFDHPPEWRGTEPTTWPWFVKNFDRWAGPTPSSAASSASRPGHAGRHREGRDAPVTGDEIRALAAELRARGAGGKP